MIRLIRNHFKSCEFSGPKCYSKATDYAKKWSLSVELSICIWEPVEPDIETGPFFVSGWNEPWPDQAVRIVCAYSQGRNNANLIHAMDDISIESRSH